MKVLNNHSFVSKADLDPSTDGSNTALSLSSTQYVSRPVQQPQLPDYIGVEGDRANFFLKFIEKRETRNTYCVYNFIDEAGHKYIVFSNDLEDPEGGVLTVGSCYLIRGTIKRHQINSYKKGQRQPVKENVLNRVLVWRAIGAKTVSSRSLGERAAAHVEGK